MRRQSTQMRCQGKAEEGDFLHQLAEQPGDELSPTTESARMPFDFMFTGCYVKAGSRNELQNLRENAAFLFKAESSSDSLVFANSPYQRLSAFFRRRSAQRN